MAEQLKKSERCFLVENYQYDPDRYSHDKLIDPGKLKYKSTQELVEAAERNEVTVSATILARHQGEIQRFKVNTPQFVRCFKEGNDYKRRMRLREFDPFTVSDGLGSPVPDLVGRDFTPLLGGPFNKQLYLQQYLQAMSQCFFAMHHDPIARAVVQITRDFTLGRSFKCTAGTAKGQAIWDAFETANKLQERMQACSLELSSYGEIMWWWLPNNYTKMTFNVTPESQMPYESFMPRIRLLDPSTCYEIVTFPEDIERVLNYTVLFPTQYEIYSGTFNGENVPTTKWIYEQIPAQEIMHYKINVVSNEKRGRSDLFPVLGYLKRLRDGIEFEMIKAQKQAAWAIDTEIDGDPQDLSDYVASQRALGTIPDGGSEFVHSKKVIRKFLESTGGHGSMTEFFQHGLSMVAMGTGIPVQWFGTHLSNAGTRAGSFTATEPVIKKMENRREVYRRMMSDMAKHLFKFFHINDEIEVTFPELVTQDTSAKIQNITLAVDNKFISQKRAAGMVAKELGIDDFNWEEEKKDIDQDMPISTPSLTGPGIMDSPDVKPRGNNAQDYTDEQKRSELQ